MKAIVVTNFVKSYQDLQPSLLPSPNPTPTQLLISISHAALNHVDLLYARGLHQNNTSLILPPFILGLEFAGTVLSASTASHFRPGDRVFGAGLGAFAEEIAVEPAAVLPVPVGWSLEEAAGVAATAPVSYAALVRVAGLKKGETVLVHAGAGGLGVMAVQVARAVGAEVVATVGSKEKRRVLEGMGVERVVEYNEEGWEGKVLDATGGKGVDVTFDSVGLVEKSVRCTRYGGRIVVVGFAGREGQMEKIAANKILLKSISVIGYRYGEHGRRLPNETAAIWEGLMDLLNQGLIKPVVYPEQFRGLESVPAAMAAMAARKIWGKAIIQVDAGRKEAKL